MEAHEPRARREVSWLGAAVRGNDLATDLLQGGIVMINGDLLLWLCPVDAEQSSDRVDPFRCGLDHLSFGVAGRAELEAAQVFEERGVSTATSPTCHRLASRSCRSRTPDEVALLLPRLPAGAEAAVGEQMAADMDRAADGFELVKVRSGPSDPARLDTTVLPD
jgi:hypothetical protein